MVVPINDPFDVFRLCSDMQRLSGECIDVLTLQSIKIMRDQQLVARGWGLCRRRRIAIGGPDRVSTDMVRVFATARKDCANGLVLVHNHVDGDVTPSADDWSASAALENVAPRLRLIIVDNVIIARGRYSSLRGGELKLYSVA